LTVNVIILSLQSDACTYDSAVAVFLMQFLRRINQAIESQTRHKSKTQLIFWDRSVDYRTVLKKISDVQSAHGTVLYVG